METVKGFNDFLGENARKREEIRKILVATFEKYGFEPAETPIIEYEEFVKEGNSQDEAVSDVFKLQDKGKRKLALRYELTFQLKRIAKNKKLPYKRYQIGEVFRDEPISSNRFRQFTQCDVDIFGSTIKDEAEILAIVQEILDELKIDFVIYLNNRNLLNEILEKEGIQNKEQVLKEIDKLNKLDEKEVRENLKKYQAEKVLNIIKKDEKSFENYPAYSEILELKNYLKYYKLDKKVMFSPSLARGLSYYNGNIFEVRVKNRKESILGGGSYKFNNVQATGISFGLDRISIFAKLDLKPEKYLIVSLNQDKETINLAQKIRKQKKIASIYYGKPSKALEYANSCDFLKVIFIGEKEIKSKKFKVKDMKTGKESLFKI